MPPLCRGLVYVVALPILLLLSVVGFILRLVLCFLPTCCVGSCLVEGALWLSRIPFLACMWVADQNTSQEE